jgi:hypothetical protein
MLPEDGTYTIEIREYFGDPGDFELTIEFIPVVDGDFEFEGELAEFGRFRQGFVAREGDEVTITVSTPRSSDLDSFLTLVDLSGEILEENDDHDSNDDDLRNSDSQIEGFEIEEDGVYIVVVTGFDDTAGEFTLTIEFD